MDSHNKIIQQVANIFFRLWDFSKKGNQGLSCTIVAIALFKLNFSHLHILAAHVQRIHILCKDLYW